MNKLLPSPFLKLVALFFALAGGFLLISNPQIYPDWFLPGITGFGAFVYLFLLILPRLLFRGSITDAEEKHDTLTKLQNVGAIAFVAGFLGTLGLHRLYMIGLPYDRLLHLVLPYLAVIALIRFLSVWYPRPIWYAMFYGVTGILLILIGWEFAEYLSDLYLGTQAFGQGGENLFSDTLWDVGLGVLGTLVGSIRIYKKNKKTNY